MKILFDAETPPDVLLFGSLAKDLEKEHDILFIARDFSETVPLLKSKKIAFEVIGAHKETKMIGRAYEHIYRMINIIRRLNKTKPDICVHRLSAASHASFMLRIPSVAINDNEKAKLTSRIALPFTTKTIFPKAISKSDIKRLFGKPKKTYFYEGVEEMIYLSDFEPDKNVLDELQIDDHQKLIVMRPEQPLAHYFRGIEGLLKPVIRELRFKNQIVLLTRSEKQREEYSKEFGNDLIIPPYAIDAPSLLYYADLFVGAHGTMSREAWVLGTPTISMYSGDQLAVEKYLVETSDRYYHTTDPDEVIDIYVDFMKHKGERAINSELKNRIIEQILNVAKVK
ncbi:MAG: DUF354 domain-containing protein [Euryarchaeota archaeon]|nr:DUF354 domain-containing protein [Euryarchaeota archaeon]